MRGLVVALAFVVLYTAPLAGARQTAAITPTSIAGIKLGISRAQARALLGKPVRLDRLEDGYERLVSPGRRIEVYFRTGTTGVAEVTTWSRTFRTERRVGPCSTIAALKAAYGTRLQPFRNQKNALAYRLGDLVFTTEGGKRVGVVALGRGTAATYVALSATECG